MAAPTGWRGDRNPKAVVPVDGDLNPVFGSGGSGASAANQVTAQTALDLLVADIDAIRALEESWPIDGHGFDVAVSPTVTAGAYSAGDIMGGLMTFPVARANDKLVCITGVQASFKVAVMPNPFSVIIFNADPTATTKTDNAAYSLNAADIAKVRKSLAFQTNGILHYDHGTPNSISWDGLGLVMAPATGTVNVFALAVDGSGTTLTSTSDFQLVFRGYGI